MDERIVFGLYQLCLGCSGVGSVEGGGLVQGMGEWDGVVCVCVVSLDYLWRWQIQVSVLCSAGTCAS